MASSDDAYLNGLPEEKRAAISQVNAPGLSRLRQLLANGEAVAFLGAGASAPLYPLWNGVIRELIDKAADRLTANEAMTCRELATTDPDAVVEMLRQRLRPELYWEVLREVFRVRRDPQTARTWTTTHELIVRCNFRGVVTTNYDPGIVDARMRVRSAASSTGFASWTDELALDTWQSGDVFLGDDEMPVLFVHGHHNQPDKIVLATTEYRRAYEGKLSRVLGGLVAGGHIVWVGFSFVDQRIAAILREIVDASGTRSSQGMAPRHIALMPWEPELDGTKEPRDPGLLRDICAMQFGSRVVLYPTPRDDHGSLAVLLNEFVDERFPAVATEPWSAREPQPASMTTTDEKISPEAVVERGAPNIAGVKVCDSGTDLSAKMSIRWVHGGEPVDHFAGRNPEMERLDRWAADSTIALIGVTAWGGAGKTALVTQWLSGRSGANQRDSARGIFGWSFYENPSEEEWADELLEWAERTFKISPPAGRRGDRVLQILANVPLVLVLDGLELLQQGPESADYGRLLAGLLRDVLTAICRLKPKGLVILTSRFPFADLERFDGGAVRMLDVPPLSLGEGSELLARTGASSLAEDQRRALVSAVDGHALAISALAGALAGQGTPASDVNELLGQLEKLTRTNERVRHVLSFYADRLSESDRALTSIVSLFQRPVEARTVLALGTSEVLGGPLTDWSAVDVRTAVQQRLSGLLTWHLNSTVSAHPLVRDSFRPLVLVPESATLAAELALEGLPTGPVHSREDALRVVEIIELLLDAGQWHEARDLFWARTERGKAFMWLPAARLGIRSALAFVGTPSLRAQCQEHLSLESVSVLLSVVAFSASSTGDIAIAQQYHDEALQVDRAREMTDHISADLVGQAECALLQGLTALASEAAREAVEATDSGRLERNARAHLGSAYAAAGETTRGELEFLAADRFEYEENTRHLYSMRGFHWAQFLSSTGRIEPARRLSEAFLETSRSNNWNEDIARATWSLGRIALASDKLDLAEEHLQAAATTFRDGEYIVDLCGTLVDLAEQQWRSGDARRAERTCNEAIDIAAPRELVPLHASVLTARAHARARTGGADNVQLYTARDDADHALRLTTKTRQLPWGELAAYNAHACIDELEGKDSGWADRAAALRETLIPDDLDPDPLVTIEHEAEESP